MKGLLLGVMIALSGIVAARVWQPFRDDFAYIGQPYILSTLLLSGAPNVVPVIYSKVNMDSVVEIRVARRCVLAAIIDQ